MTREEILSLIQTNKELPTLIALYARFREKIANPQTSAAEIATIISADQAIASRVLRSANSPFYGLSNRITTISHAIVIIGFNGIHYLALNMAAQNLYQGSQQNVAGFDVSSLWKHSMATAVISRMLAKTIRYPNLEEMFSAGLLHDIGKIFILRYLTRDFEQVIANVNSRHMRIIDAEEEVIGIAHTEIGALLLSEWQLPQTLVLTAAHHHNPVLAKDKIKEASIVHLADILAKAFEIGSGGDYAIGPLNEEAWSCLNIEQETLDGIVQGIDTELKHFNFFA